MVIAWGLNAPLRQAVAWALMGGVLFDVMSATPLGTSALGLALMVLLMDTVRLRFYELSWLFLGIMGLFGTALYQFYQMAMLDAFHLLGLMPADAPFQITWGDDLLNRTAPVMLYNVVLVLPVYLLLRVSQRRLPAAL
jgi:rod shape-determining protein MreD